MTQLTGHPQILHSDTTTIDTEQKAVPGLRTVDKQGNEYIYLKGVGGTTAGSWVTYDENYATTLLAADAVGPVAIAKAAIVASDYGWYQVYGVNTDAKTDTISADKALYIDGTAGRVDDLGIAGDLVIGAYSMTADASNVATVFIIYPHVSNDLGGSASAVFTDSEVPSGTVNGTNGTDGNATFTLAATPTAGSVHLYVNGIRQKVGASEDYTISGVTITFISPSIPITNSKILADYRS
jgi:hypothetical protein